MPTRLLVALGFCLALALFLAPVGGADAAPSFRRATPTPMPRSMSVFGYRFKPSVLRVRPGTTVTWINGDRDDHAITGITYRDTFGNTYSICPERACPPPPDGVIAPPTPPPASDAYDDVPILDSEEEIQDPDEGCGFCARPTPPRPTPRPSGYTYSYTFAEPGSYAIKCTIHPRMAMTVVVR